MDTKHTPELKDFLKSAWRADATVNMVFVDGTNWLVCEAGTVLTREIVEKIAADHNALAGIENPAAALAMAREALVEIVACEFPSAPDHRRNVESARRALAALTPKGGAQ